MNKIYHHIYNRGAHKALIFQDGLDYRRMQKLLYISNSPEPFEFRGLPENIYEVKRKSPLVDIIAYCLMPNHIHIVLESKVDENIPLFMKKLCTAYSNYFNKKYDHSGTIWQGPYKLKTAFDREYKNTLINYVHLNPYGLKEPEKMKEVKKYELEEAIEFSKNYAYSSFQDYIGISRPERAILFPDVSHPEFHSG